MPNLLDCYVTEVLTAPSFHKGWVEDGVTIPDEWRVKVNYDSYGSISAYTLRLATKEEAEAIKPGYHFMEMF